MSNLSKTSKLLLSPSSNNLTLKLNDISKCTQEYEKKINSHLDTIAKKNSEIVQLREEVTTLQNDKISLKAKLEASEETVKKLLKIVDSKMNQDKVLPSGSKSLKDKHKKDYVSMNSLHTPQINKVDEVINFSNDDVKKSLFRTSSETDLKIFNKNQDNDITHSRDSDIHDFLPSGTLPNLFPINKTGKVKNIFCYCRLYKRNNSYTIY